MKNLILIFLAVVLAGCTNGLQPANKSSAPVAKIRAAATSNPNAGINVQSVVGNCAAATGDGSTDDTAAIQCHLNYMYTGFGGGIVNFPPGNYLVGGGLVVQGNVQLIGSGQASTWIRATTDTNVVTFDSSTCLRSASMSNLSVFGYQSASATTSAVTIGDNCSVILRDDTIWYGAVGLNNNGVDSLIENSFIFGYVASVYSRGSNWYVRDKLDTLGPFTPGAYTSVYAFYQGAGINGQLGENHLIQCDLDGSYHYSIYIDDPTNQAITVVDGSIISSPIYINGAMWTNLTNDEIGGTITPNGGKVTVTGSYAFAPITIGGTNVIGANNFNITIPNSVAERAIRSETKVAMNDIDFSFGAIGALSDLRHKQNIQALSQNTLDQLLRLRPVTFEWKDAESNDMNGMQMGFIAQEVQKIYPSAILAKENKEKTLGIKYNELISVVTKAVQEFYAKWLKDSQTIHEALDSLKADTNRDVASLKAENANLRARLDVIEAKLNEKNK